MRRANHIYLLLAVVAMMMTAGCSTQKNTSGSRWWHSFTARYNTFYNGKQAYIDGSLEQEKGNKDNFTELIPLNTVGNKQSRTLGKGNFDRAVEKSEKAIKQHSIKARPEWKKSRRKTEKDKEWLSRREYNPFIWKAWLLLGKSQFKKGEFDEAAATFSYMSRLYQTQPLPNSMARAWLAQSYLELGWLYDAEDVIRNMNRDSVHYKAQRDWDHTLAAYHIKNKDYEAALPYLRKSIKHEKRRVQKAREWFLLGQIETLLGHREQAYKAFGRVISQNPPYETEFNARIAQTEVMAKGNAKKMIARLRRMSRSDKNKDFLDQVFYAMGNIYLMQKDTVRAIAAYEEGNEKATRSGIEKGVLLLRLGGLYWDCEKYNDAQRCYGEAIGLLDKDRPDYEELSQRSKVLDELVPHTDAVYLQDSLQALAKMPEKERLAAIDRVIEALKKKEKEEADKAREAEVEQALQKQGATGQRNQRPNATQQTPQNATQQKDGLWYFYNPMAVSQGKQQFEKLWGKRENADNWRRLNQTVVNLLADAASQDGAEGAEAQDSLALAQTMAADTLSQSGDTTATDTLANDPHNREYYLAQIPFTEEQVAASNLLIMDGLYNSGVIFKDKLDNLRLSEKQLLRLTNQYPDFAQTDLAWYHLFLLYSRQGRHDTAEACLSHLKADFPDSEWTQLLSDPYFEENARFGTHIEDSVYAATYEAFKKSRYEEVKNNARLSEERFPMGENRPKFIFIDGLSLLNEGDAQGCVERLRKVVQDYPNSEVSEMAGMIVKGVQEGRPLYGGKFDLDDVWSRRDLTLSEDSTQADTLSAERNTEFLFLLAYQPDSLGTLTENQLLFELARYNFTNFMVRNFEIAIEQASGGIHRMTISGFLSFDEALQYARQLYGDEHMKEVVRPCRSIVISAHNLSLIGSRYSYKDYDEFYQRTFQSLPVSDEELLQIPEDIVQPDEDDEDGGEDSEGTEGTEGEDSEPQTGTNSDDFDIDDLF